MSFNHLAVLLFTFVLYACGEGAENKKTQNLPSKVGFKTQLSAYDSKASTAGGKCAIGTINGTTVNPDNLVVKSRGISIEGWAVGENSSISNDLAIKLVPVTTGVAYFALATRKLTPGLGQALGNSALDGAGFELFASLDSVPLGRYAVVVLQRLDSKVIACEPNIGTTIN